MNCVLGFRRDEEVQFRVQPDHGVPPAARVVDPAVRVPRQDGESFLSGVGNGLQLDPLHLGSQVSHINFKITIFE